MAGQEEGAGQENYPDREGGAGAERIRGEESLISSPVVGGGWWVRIDKNNRDRITLSQVLTGRSASDGLSTTG